MNSRFAESSTHEAEKARLLEQVQLLGGGGGAEPQVVIEFKVQGSRFRVQGLGFRSSKTAYGKVGGGGASDESL